MNRRINRLRGTHARAVMYYKKNQRLIAFIQKHLKKDHDFYKIQNKKVDF